MWCIEKCMKFLNKNAYIQTAIFGYSFCTAARKAFFLILRNLKRITAVAMVAGVVLFMGKLIVPVAVAFVAYNVLQSLDLHGIFLPLVITFVISFMTMEMFNEVFDMCIATVLQCYVADEEMFGDGGGVMYVPGNLKSTISTTNAAADWPLPHKTCCTPPPLSAHDPVPAPNRAGLRNGRMQGARRELYTHAPSRYW